MRALILLVGSNQRVDISARHEHWNRNLSFVRSFILFIFFIMRSIRQCANIYYIFHLIKVKGKRFESHYLNKFACRRFFDSSSCTFPWHFGRNDSATMTTMERSEVLILVKNAEQKEEGEKNSKASKNAAVYRHNCDAMTINRFTGNTL